MGRRDGTKTKSPRRTKAQAHRNRKSQSGQATIEYILLISFVVATTVFMSKRILTGLDKGLVHFGAQLEMDLKTGRAPAVVYSN